MRQPRSWTLTQIAAGVVLVISLVGCGRDGGPGDGGKPVRRSIPLATMAETCVKVETAMREVGGDWFPVPTRKEADELLGILDELVERGDEESRSALRLLSDPIDSLVVDYPEPGGEMVNASKRMDGGIGAFADRCKAAGEPIQVRGGNSS